MGVWWRAATRSRNGASMNLQADSVHGVLFVAPGQQQDEALKLWDFLFPGHSPDGFQRNTSSPSLASTASGERNGYQVGLTAQVGRIDITINKQQNTFDANAGPPRIANVADALNQLVGLMKKVVGRVNVHRIGIILDLSKTVARGTENAELMHLLAGFPFPDNASDISVQFNSRVLLEGVANTEINRLCTWASGQFHFIPNAPVPSHALVPTPFVNVKIDINTIPTLRLAASDAELVLDAMLAESRALYAEGLKRLIP